MNLEAKVLFDFYCEARHRREEVNIDTLLACCPLEQTKELLDAINLIELLY